MRTRADMEKDYGSIPPAIPDHFTWTIHRAHATVSWVTSDGGDTWKKKDVVWAAERARRDEQALEQARIQQELK